MAQLRRQRKMVWTIAQCSNKELRPFRRHGSGRSWQRGGMTPTAYRRNARGLRDGQAFERIRLQAGELLPPAAPKPRSPTTSVSPRQNVSRWHALWRAGGSEALRSAGPTGHPPRLSDPQLEAVRQVLRQGAHAHGFDTDHWTLARAPA
jgi:hypothetical protein